MSEPKNSAGDKSVLPSFDDMMEPTGGFTPPAPAEGKPSHGAKKEVLPDFSDENDRTSVLPPSSDMSDDAGTSVKRKAPEDRMTGGKSKKSEDRTEGQPSELVPSKPKEAIKAEKKGKKTDDDPPKKKKQNLNIVKEEKNQTSSSAKALFIVCMILSAPFVLIVLTAAFMIFALLFTAAILLAGVLAIALIALVVAGVVLALTGITYGLIEMVSKTGFAFYAGQYELGLGLAITGITIILSSLLYAGATSFVPFLIKQLGRLIRFLWTKLKGLFKKVYDYSTHL
ncbi:MAG: hypothetical protein IJU52_04080 [Clostridia bacterium]|nr:hypothetical protein [Clostridia bacterium]